MLVVRGLFVAWIIVSIFIVWQSWRAATFFDDFDVETLEINRKAVEISKQTKDRVCNSPNIDLGITCREATSTYLKASEALRNNEAKYPPFKITASWLLQVSVLPAVFFVVGSALIWGFGGFRRAKS